MPSNAAKQKNLHKANLENIYFLKCIWETLNLSMCGDSSTKTKPERNKQKVFFFMLHVICHVSVVTFHMSDVTC